MFYQFFCKESALLPPNHASRTTSCNIIDRNPSMVIPLLANRDLTPMLFQIGFLRSPINALLIVLVSTSLKCYMQNISIYFQRWLCCWPHMSRICYLCYTNRRPFMGRIVFTRILLPRRDNLWKTLSGRNLLVSLPHTLTLLTLLRH